VISRSVCASSSESKPVDKVYIGKGRYVEDDPRKYAVRSTRAPSR